MHERMLKPQTGPFLLCNDAAYQATSELATSTAPETEKEQRGLKRPWDFLSEDAMR